MLGVCGICAAVFATFAAFICSFQGGDREVARHRQLPVAVDEWPADHANAISTIVFLHGWPDNANVWRRQISFFTAAGYHCVALELPNHGNYGEKAAWGYDFDILAAQLNNAIRALRNASDKPLVFVGHDWGAWIGYMAQRASPDLYDAFIPLDVAPGNGWVPFDVNWRVLTYQIFNLAAFLLGFMPVVGTAMANQLLRCFVFYAMGRVTSWGSFGDPLTPTPWEDLRASMGFTYWHTWRPPRLFFAALWRTHGLQGWCDCPLDVVKIGCTNVCLGGIAASGELPSCPMLFMYGNTTGLRLAGKDFVHAMQETPKGSAIVRRVAAFPMHHWFFHHLAEQVNAEMFAFLGDIGLAHQLAKSTDS